MSHEAMGFLPCSGGPYDGNELMAGDDVPEGWRITLSVPTGRTQVYTENHEVVPEMVRGVYVRKGERLVWEDME